MVQSLLGGYPCDWVKNQQLLQKIDSLRRYFSADCVEVVLRPLGESHLEVLQVLDVRPAGFGWRSQNSKYLEDLVYFRISTEQTFFMCQLEEDASNRPRVNSGVVFLHPQQNLGSPVPKRDYLVGVLPQGVGVGPGQSEVGQLDIETLPVDQNVLGLEVAVHYPPGVAVLEGEEQLVDDRADLLLVEVDALLVLFQVAVDVLEDKVELALGRHNFLHADDVGVVQLFKQGDLPDGG